MHFGRVRQRHIDEQLLQCFRRTLYNQVQSQHLSKAFGSKRSGNRREVTHYNDYRTLFTADL